MLLNPPQCSGRPLPIQKESPQVSFVSTLRIRGVWGDLVVVPVAPRSLGSWSAPEPPPASTPGHSVHGKWHQGPLGEWSPQAGQGTQGLARRRPSQEAIPSSSCLLVFTLLSPQSAPSTRVESPGGRVVPRRPPCLSSHRRPFRPDGRLLPSSSQLLSLFHSI